MERLQIFLPVNNLQLSLLKALVHLGCINEYIMCISLSDLVLDAGGTKIIKHNPYPQGTNVGSKNFFNRTRLKVEACLVSSNSPGRQKEKGISGRKNSMF